MVDTSKKDGLLLARAGLIAGLVGVLDVSLLVLRVIPIENAGGMLHFFPLLVITFLSFVFGGMGWRYPAGKGSVYVGCMLAAVLVLVCLGLYAFNSADL